MFTLTDMPVKFVGLLLLFGWTTLWCIHELRRRQDRGQRISNAIHLVMSLVMVAMVSRTVWHPFTQIVPVAVWIGFFALSVVWFGALAIRSLRNRGTGEASLAPHFIGHGVMMAAMTWHLSAMEVKMAHMGAGMKQWMMRANQPGGALWTVALIGLPLMAYLLAASLWEVSKAIRPAASGQLTLTPGTQRPLLEVAGCHEPRPVGSMGYRLSGLAGFAMNFGMFWMSTGLMTALIPAM